MNLYFSIKMFTKKKIKDFRTLCKSFPINIWINRYNNHDVITYILYVIFLPFEIFWGGVRIIEGLLLNAFKINYKYNTAIVSIIKNEAPYLNEWITYHNSVLGIDHFYLYNNNSNDNTIEILEKYIKTGLVTFIDIKGSRRQVDAYNLAIFKHRKVTKYMIIIDADEFLQITDANYKNIYNLIDPILKKKNVGGIGVNWCMFGSNGEKKYRDGLVIERFLSCAFKDNSSNHYIKSIVNPRLTIGFYWAHAANYFPCISSVDCIGNRIEGSITDNVLHNPLRLNHYFTKSAEEYEKKRNRGMADRKGIRNEDNYNRYDLNDVLDNSMLQYSVLINNLINK